MFSGDNQEESIKVQVVDSSNDYLLKEIGELRKCIDEITAQFEKLFSEENVLQKTCHISRRSISSQTEDQITQHPKLPNFASETAPLHHK